MATPLWRGLAIAQAGVLARRQLRALGVDSDRVRNQLAAGRWQAVTPTVVCTTTGELTWEQRLWSAALHCGGETLVGGLSAAKVHGLRGWDRAEATVLVRDESVLEPVDGVRIIRTRRPLADFRDPGSELPLCRIEPAVLLHAGYTRSSREGLGLLAACVQQRLTTAARLQEWTLRMRPLRRSRVRRRDSSGRLRFTDCEWRLGDGRVLVLEIDGAFHQQVEHWEDDIARQRALTADDRLVVRATAREVRDEAELVVADLVRLGVPRRVPKNAV